MAQIFSRDPIIFIILLLCLLFICCANVLFQKNKKRWFQLVTALGLFLLYLLCFSRIEMILTPSPSEMTFEQIVGNNLGGFSVSNIEGVNGNFKMAIAKWSLMDKIAGIVFLRSGPPAYVFDDKKNLVSWSTDMYRDSKFLSKWVNKPVFSKSND